MVYSFILRLRGLYIVRCFLLKRKYCKRDFEEHFLKAGISKRELDKLISIYRAARDDLNVPKAVIRQEVYSKLAALLDRDVAHTKKIILERIK